MGAMDFFRSPEAPSCAADGCRDRDLRLLKKPPPPPLDKSKGLLLDGLPDDPCFTVISRGSETAITVIPPDKSARKRLMHGMQAVIMDRFSMHWYQSVGVTRYQVTSEESAAYMLCAVMREARAKPGTLLTSVRDYILRTLVHITYIILDPNRALTVQRFIEVTCTFRIITMGNATSAMSVEMFQMCCTMLSASRLPHCPSKFHGVGRLQRKARANSRATAQATVAIPKPLQTLTMARGGWIAVISSRVDILANVKTGMAKRSDT